MKYSYFYPVRIPVREIKFSIFDIGTALHSKNETSIDLNIRLDKQTIITNNLSHSRAKSLLQFQLISNVILPTLLFPKLINIYE